MVALHRASCKTCQNIYFPFQITDVEIVKSKWENTSKTEEKVPFMAAL